LVGKRETIVPKANSFVREIQAAVDAVEAFRRKFKDEEVLSPDCSATGLDLQQCIWSAKMFLMMTVEMTSTDVSLADH
jgi:hypothetical protein